MHPKLTDICKEFEKLKGFLKDSTKEKEEKLNKIFFEFIECFSELKEEKLDYPKEFITDTKLYKEGYEPIIKKFEDKQIRYLILSDFYDFVRIKKIYKKNLT